MIDEPYQLAGDRVILTHGENGTSTLTFSDKGTGRTCGSCTLCCKLPPVPGPPLFKPAGVRCKYARTGKGCSIYATRPMPCRVWACRWLADTETAGMPRPDRCHYVIDVVEDYVELAQDDGSRIRVGVIQVWVDPSFREAYRAPELRAYMQHMAEKYRLATIIRYSSREAITIFPAAMAADGKWHEYSDGVVELRDDDERALEALQRYQVGFTDETP